MNIVDLFCTNNSFTTFDFIIIRRNTISFTFCLINGGQCSEKNIETSGQHVVPGVLCIFALFALSHQCSVPWFFKHNNPDETY